MWSFVYREVFSTCKTVVLERSTTNQVLVCLLIVYYNSISCSFPYTTRVSSPNIAEHGCPPPFLANFRRLHQFIVDTNIDTKKHGKENKFHCFPSPTRTFITSNKFAEEFNVANLSLCEIKCRMILCSQVNLSARKTRYTVL